MPLLPQRLLRPLQRLPISVIVANVGTLAAFLLIDVLWNPYFRYFPFPISILTVVIVYSVFRAGVRAGLASSTLTIGYFAHFLNVTGAFQRDPGDAWNRLLSWTVALPIIVVFVGRLKKKSLSAATFREQERSVHEITEAMPQIVWTATAQGYPQFFNEQWLSYTGLKLSQSLGLLWQSAMHPDDLVAAEGPWKQSLVTRMPFSAECRLLRKTDNTYRWHLARALPIIDKGGKVKKWVGTFTDIHDQKTNEAQTEAYKKRTEAIIATMPAVMWSVDADGIFTFSEGAALASVGLRPGERVGKSIFEIYPATSEVARCTRLALNGQDSSATFKVANIWFESQFSGIRDANNAVVGVVGVTIDVSDRVESQSAKAQLAALQDAAKLVHASEAKFKGAFENSPIGIALAQPDGVWFDVNASFCQMMGCEKNQLLAASKVDANNSADALLGLDQRRKMLEGDMDNFSYEQRYVNRLGVTLSVWINGSVIRTDQGQVQFILVQMLDVTEKRRDEKALRDTTNRLQTLINSAPVGILALNTERKVTLWNPACEKMFGWTSAEVLGKPLPFVPENKRAESIAIIDRINQTREPIHFEADRIKKDGNPIKTGTEAIPLIDDQDQVAGLMAVMSDITDQYNQQQEIISTNKALRSATKAKSEFLANMSHEIRTPINGVMGMAGLLLDMDLGAEQRNYAETIKDSAGILLTLVNDILDFSKIEAGKLDLETIDFDIDSVLSNIERILTFSAHKKNLQIVRSPIPALASQQLRGDPTRIGQVLANLISNAIKFTQQGTVHLNLIVEDTVLNADGRATHLKMLIEVTDTGIGMSSETLSRMFQPFMQADSSTNRRYGGTGLGLSISKHLVELMGGEIGVRSREGLGSTFWFSLQLPISQTKAQLPRDSQESWKPKPTAKPLHILLADDNTVNQLIAIKMLEKKGMRVDAVSNGLEAIDALQGIQYDLVLMDCQMPELDGYEATQRIRVASDRRISNIPIVAMTANAMAGDREKCLDAGMNDYVTKPVKADDLVAAIYRNLDPAKHKKAA